MNKEAINKWVLLLLVFFISALFLSMISQFLMAIFLAGIFSALSYPLYRRFEKWFKGRRQPGLHYHAFDHRLCRVIAAGRFAGNHHRTGD